MSDKSSSYQSSDASQGSNIPLLRYWYYLAAPPEPPASAPLLQREVARRGRVISLVILVTIAMVLFAFLIQPSLSVSITLIVVTCIDIVALTFNRRGKITIAGAIITSVTEGGLILSLFGLLQSTHGVDIQTVIFYPLLVQGIIVAVSTLPLFCVLFVLLLNCALTFITLTFVPYTPALTNYIHANSSITWGYLITTPYTVFMIVAFISFIWVHSANDAIKRADRADARAEYEQEIARRDRERTDQLAHSLQEIMLVVAGIGNDPTKEFQIDQANNLWPLATSLNNLRRRLINVNFELSEYYRTRASTAELVSWLDTALSQGTFPNWNQSKTAIDEVVFRIRMLPVPVPSHQQQPIVGYGKDSFLGQPYAPLKLYLYVILI